MALSGRRRPGRGGFGNSAAPGQGEGWFENLRIGRTSFVCNTSSERGFILYC